MSRVDDAWRRTAGAQPASRDSAARIGQPPDAAETELREYPEEPSSGVAAREALKPRTVVAPRTGEHGQLAPRSERAEHRLITGDQANLFAVEQYRRLAGALHDLQVQQGLTTLMVTSAMPAEGKSLTVTNLALTLSEGANRRVLLIDADLRRPTVHDLFRIPNVRGLGDVLASDRAELPLVQVSTNLSVLPAGRLTQPMALTSDRMRQLLEQSAASYDWVLIDAAPVGFMPDAQLLARLTRAVLFVIAANVTPHAMVARALNELGPECIVGTVLNKMAARDIPAADYYHNYYSASGLEHA